MGLYYKIDVLEALKKEGYSTYRIQKEKIFGKATEQKLRTGEGIGWNNLEKICSILKMQPGDIIGYEE